MKLSQRVYSNYDTTEPYIYIDVCRNLIESLRHERPFDVRDAFFVMNTRVARRLVEHARRVGYRWPMLMEEPPRPVSLVRPLADEIREELTCSVLGMEVRISDRVEPDLIEIWIENETERALRRTIEQYGSAKVQVIETPGACPLLPTPTLHGLISHWRKNLRKWVHGIVAKARRQV